MSSAFLTAVVDSGILFSVLPPHTTHLLQPLDVGIFGPEAHWISVALDEAAYTGASSISSLELLQIVLEARPRALRSHNIFSAWRESGISPYQPQIVLEKLRRDCPSTPEHRSLGEAGQQLATPRQPADVHALINCQIDKGYTSPTELAALSKMGKACKELLAANELLLRENRGLKRGLEQREVRRERLPGPEGMFISPDNREEVSDWLRERHKEEKRLNLRREHLRHLQQHMPEWKSRKRLGGRSLLTLKVRGRQQGYIEERTTQS